MPDLCIHRLRQIIREAWHRSRAWTPGVQLPADEFTAALLASEDWQAREAVVRMARSEHEHCDGKALDEDETAPCGMCAALLRLDAGKEEGR